MKKIHKLVLKAYLGPLVATFFIVQFVLMMNFVWRYIDELTGKGLDVGTRPVTFTHVLPSNTR